ncbi:uncharacterized protein Dana_GF26941, isoform A [Drosophila ananassae]|uniref:Uncharacterized protein, isoform A n=1 Tax=Drosophila ananassae TaxID=7217 RepID=A0A0P8XG48_DROAN|nr:uncharacterized protein Dana_GF26941, isoform A [Drosophila ananassae]
MARQKECDDSCSTGNPAKWSKLYTRYPQTALKITNKDQEPTDPKVIPPMKHTRQVIMMLPTCHHHHPPTASLPLCLPGARRPRTCEDTSHDQPVGASQSVHCTEILSTGSSKGGDHGK